MFGIAELLILLLPIVVVPLLLCIALRIFAWFAEVCNVPAALGSLAAKVVRAYQAERGLDA